MKPALLAFSLLLAIPAVAGELRVTVRDQEGQPVADAVVFLGRAAGEAAARPGPGTIDQVDKRFVPEVSAIAVGTAVNFPNKDAIRHHVYSFSPAKPFELELYSGEPAAPVTFDKPGLVTIGCNIHDNMLAYVYIVDSDHYALTDAQGMAVLPGLPGGQRLVGAWHYRMDAEPAPAATAVTLGDGPTPLEAVLTLNHDAPDLAPLED